MEQIALMFIIVIGIIMILSSLFTGRKTFTFSGLILVLIGGVLLISILPSLVSWAAKILRILLIIVGACLLIYLIARIIRRINS